jgi:hypothetical protein
MKRLIESGGAKKYIVCKSKEPLAVPAHSAAKREKATGTAIVWHGRCCQVVCRVEAGGLVLINDPAAPAAIAKEWSDEWGQTV